MKSFILSIVFKQRSNRLQFCLCGLLSYTNLFDLFQSLPHDLIAFIQGILFSLCRFHHQISLQGQQFTHIIIWMFQLQSQFQPKPECLSHLSIMFILSDSLTITDADVHLIISDSLINAIRKRQTLLQIISVVILFRLLMKIHKYLAVDQNSDDMEKLADKNGTTYGICGFITCALTQYLANLADFTPELLPKINEQVLTPLIDEAMKSILARRRLQLKKFYKVMSDGDRKKYLKAWVANYEIADYLENRVEKWANKQVYFFRQSAYDHPAELALVEFQEKERIVEEQPFKGHRFFYSSFLPDYVNHFKEEFQGVLRQADPNLPVIIATDIFQHFYTVVLFQGQIYILDSLSSYLQRRHDSEIVECIQYIYKQSYLIKEPQ